MFWPLLFTGYMAIVTWPVTSSQLDFLDTTDPRWGQPQGKPEVAEPGWEQLPWSQQQTWRSGPGHGKEDSQDYDSDILADKRALSVLSRWKPFTSTLRSSGRPYRTSKTMSGFMPGLDFVSAETRANGGRPVGQPMRFGRRR